MKHEEIVTILEEYLKMQTTERNKPTWFDCLSFLSGYCGTLTLNMVMVARKLQREGRVE